MRPWLRRVASNLSIGTAETGAILSLRELGARVDAALPEWQRLAITLFHYEGMSQLEVGEVLGISDEATESLLARARRTLKAALKEEWRTLIPESEA